MCLTVTKVHCHELTQNWQSVCFNKDQKTSHYLMKFTVWRCSIAQQPFLIVIQKDKTILPENHREVSLITMWNMIERRWFFFNTQQAKSDQVHNRANAKLYINISTSQINGFYHEVPQHIRSAFVLFLDMMYSSISPRQISKTKILFIPLVIAENNK